MIRNKVASPLQTPAGSFSLPPLDARRWRDHENGRGGDSRSQQRKEVTVALTRPSASESSRKRLSCTVCPGLRGSARLYDRGEWAGPSSKRAGPTADTCDKPCWYTISIANDQVGENSAYFVTWLVLLCDCMSAWERWGCFPPPPPHDCTNKNLKYQTPEIRMISQVLQA